MSTDALRDQIRDSRIALDLANAAQRLQDSKDFKEVIQENLFTDKVIALTSKLALFPIDSAEFKHVVRELDAISYLKNYLTQLNLTGAEAQVSIQDAQNILNNAEE